MFSVRFFKCVCSLQPIPWIIALKFFAFPTAEMESPSLSFPPIEYSSSRNAGELWSHSVIHAELLKLPRTFCRGVLWFFLDDVPGTQIEEQRFSLEIAARSLFPLSSQPFVLLISLPASLSLRRPFVAPHSSFSRSFYPFSLHFVAPRVLRYKFQRFLASLAIHLLVSSRVLISPCLNISTKILLRLR